MSLDNLVKTGQLKPHETTVGEIRRLLSAVQRNLQDARVVGLSDETRFDTSYKAIMQCALVALMASGYRPATNAPGHHQTMIASLRLTLGASQPDWLVLDALRRKRNLNDYTGDPIDAASVHECIERAEALLVQTRQWLEARHARLLNDP